MKMERLTAAHLEALSPKMKRWMQVTPPAPLKATLAKLAHLETGMVVAAGDAEVAQMMQRPYTSGGDSTHFESFTFSTRPSTSLCESRASSRSRQFSPVADSRGYESFEQLLTPNWSTPSPSPKRVSSFKVWARKPSTAPAKTRPRRIESEETMEEESSQNSETASAQASEQSIDVGLSRSIGGLLPEKNVWAPVLEPRAEQKKRRQGIDEDMMELARFAVAAQQAALREREEQNLVSEALPGVYFGHLERPQLRLPGSTRLARLQGLQWRKMREDTAEQRKRFQILDDKVLEQDPLRSLPSGAVRLQDLGRSRATASRKAVVATWEAPKPVAEPAALSKEEQERLKEEKAAYDDWRRQVLACTRLLSTHINRFETEPMKAAPRMMF